MAITKIQTGGIPALAVTHDKLHTTMDLSGKTVTLPTLSSLNTTGSVGIGTDSIVSYSKVTIYDASTKNPGVVLQNTTTGQTSNDGLFVGLGIGGSGDASTAYIYHRENGPLVFATNNTERIRIDAGGILNVTSGGAPIIPTIKHSGIDPYLAKIRLINRSGQYIDKGGLVELGGITNDEVTRTDVFASVAGLKATTASNNRTGYMQFSVNDGSALTERMRIDSSGNVGIGTSDPSTMLHLSAGTTNGQGGSDAGITMTNKYDNPDNSWSIKPAIQGVSNTGLEIRDVTDSRSVMVFDGSGNVGIGTNSPSYKLDVASHIQIRAGESLRLQNVAGSSAATISCDGAGTNSDLSFKTANTERMRIDSSGRVTTPNQPRVFAQGNINNWSNNTANQIYTAWQTTGADGSYAVGISFNAANGRFTVPVAGTYYIHSSKYCRIGPSYNTSAARLNLRKNGGQWTNQHLHSYENIPDISISIEGLVPMAAGDYFTIDDSYATEHYRGAVHTYLHAYLVG
jgi:hypothetical protein